MTLARQLRDQKKTENITTKRTKSTKEENIFKIRCRFRCPIFVSFAIFVVRLFFLNG
jgi:hypothetical protein